jgi:hypothetical protein
MTLKLLFSLMLTTAGHDWCRMSNCSSNFCLLQKVLFKVTTHPNSSFSSFSTFSGTDHPGAADSSSTINQFSTKPGALQ